MKARAFGTGDEDAVRVLFRVCKVGRDAAGEVTAVFPDLPATTDGRLVTCYAHQGQHGAGDLGYVLRQSRPATPAEYAPLRRELEGKPYGYKLAIRRRYVRGTR